MKSRASGQRKPCVYCKAPTQFVREVVGPRGAVRYEDVCTDCGEQPARRGVVPTRMLEAEARR